MGSGITSALDSTDMESGKADSIARMRRTLTSYSSVVLSLLLSNAVALHLLDKYLRKRLVRDSRIAIKRACLICYSVLGKSQKDERDLSSKLLHVVTRLNIIL